MILSEIIKQVIEEFGLNDNQFYHQHLFNDSCCTISKLYVMHYTSLFSDEIVYEVGDPSYRVFKELPSRDLAEQIKERLKDTEFLFI